MPISGITPSGGLNSPIRLPSLGDPSLLTPEEAHQAASKVSTVISAADAFLSALQALPNTVGDPGAMEAVHDAYDQLKIDLGTNPTGPYLALANAAAKISQETLNYFNPLFSSQFHLAPFEKDLSIFKIQAAGEAFLSAAQTAASFKHVCSGYLTAVKAMNKVAAIVKPLLPDSTVYFFAPLVDSITLYAENVTTGFESEKPFSMWVSESNMFLSCLSSEYSKS